MIACSFLAHVATQEGETPPCLSPATRITFVSTTKVLSAIHVPLLPFHCGDGPRGQLSHLVAEKLIGPVGYLTVFVDMESPYPWFRIGGRAEKNGNVIGTYHAFRHSPLETVEEML
jgi:hypothetical protein